VQQNEVPPDGMADPDGCPPPAVTEQVPAVVSVGGDASLTGSGPVKATQVLGASSEPPMQFVMAGAPMVHAAPTGGSHAHAEQPRVSSTLA
jgi:hypothetical protein